MPESFETLECQVGIALTGLMKRNIQHRPLGRVIVLHRPLARPCDTAAAINEASVKIELLDLMVSGVEVRWIGVAFDA